VVLLLMRLPLLLDKLGSLQQLRLLAARLLLLLLLLLLLQGHHGPACLVA
jgi:hypothetical protein